MGREERFRSKKERGADGTSLTHHQSSHSVVAVALGQGGCVLLACLPLEAGLLSSGSEAPTPSLWFLDVSLPHSGVPHGKPHEPQALQVSFSSQGRRLLSRLPPWLEREAFQALLLRVSGRYRNSSLSAPVPINMESKPVKSRNRGQQRARSMILMPPGLCLCSCPHVKSPLLGSRLTTPLTPPGVMR